MTFDTAFDRLFANEGGYVNNPTDPGGETNWGISKRSYPNLNIKELTRDDAKLIYQRDFWSRISADHLPAAVTFQAFDFAVNSGIETAVRKLQVAIGVADDGHWGSVSAAAMAKFSECELVLRFNAQRLRFMTSLSNWPNAGKGWVRRIANDLDYGAQDT